MADPTAGADATDGPDGTGATDGDAGDADEDAYSGLFGAFPYAFRASESRLFRSYVAVGGLVALLVALLFGLALVALFGRTIGAPGGTFTFVRAFYVLVGLFAVAPLLAPVLLVARRHRRDGGATARYDAALALGGYLVAVSLYLGAVVTAPEGLRDPPRGTLAPVVATLYALPPEAGLVLPALASALLYALHRTLR